MFILSLKFHQDPKKEGVMTLYFKVQPEFGRHLTDLPRTVVYKKYGGQGDPFFIKVCHHLKFWSTVEF